MLLCSSGTYLKWYYRINFVKQLKDKLVKDSSLTDGQMLKIYLKATILKLEKYLQKLYRNIRKLFNILLCTSHTYTNT